MLSQAEVRAKLITEIPDWVEACESSENEMLLLHQDAFAVDHDLEELQMFGWAIKYAGMCGKNVQIIATLSTGPLSGQ